MAVIQHAVHGVVMIGSVYIKRGGRGQKNKATRQRACKAVVHAYKNMLFS